MFSSSHEQLYNGTQLWLIIENSTKKQWKVRNEGAKRRHESWLIFWWELLQRLIFRDETRSSFLFLNENGTKRIFDCVSGPEVILHLLWGCVCVCVRRPLTRDGWWLLDHQRRCTLRRFEDQKHLGFVACCSPLYNADFKQSFSSADNKCCFWYWLWK